MRSSGVAARKTLWTWLYIKLGRGEMRPIAARQYGRNEQKGGSHVGPRLARCLDAVSAWLRGRLPDVVLRAYDRDDSPPVVVLSDAMFKPPDIGHGACVLWVPSRAGPGGYLAFADGSASPEVIAAVRKLREQKTLIMPLEAMSMGAPYFCVEILPSIEGRDVLHFADNTAANSGVWSAVIRRRLI